MPFWQKNSFMRKAILLFSSFWLLLSQSYSQSITNSSGFIPHQKDTLYFSKPKLLMTLAHFPSNMLGITKTPFIGENWIATVAYLSGHLATMMATITVKKENYPEKNGLLH